MKYLPKYTPTEVRNDPYGFTYKEMSEVIGENEAKALYSELYKQAPRKKNLSMLVKDIYKSSDTEKYVYELKDNKYIETVFIKRRDGGTVCVSTQVGCPVGCIFCESGRNGFVRNLTPSEIVQQVILLRRKVNRIVFMGMGEPLFNYDNLIKAIHILRDRSGLNFPTDGITISTVGPVDQLKKLREARFFIWLHGEARDEARNEARLAPSRGHNGIIWGFTGSMVEPNPIYIIYSTLLYTSSYLRTAYIETVIFMDSKVKYFYLIFAWYY